MTMISLSAEEILGKLEKTGPECEFSIEELTCLVGGIDGDVRERMYSLSRSATDAVFGRRVYFRGLIEFTNYCARDCLYCGIRRSNTNAVRYRLTPDQIMQCCEVGHTLGYRSFVLQGGEDAYFDDEIMVQIVSSIRKSFSDSAITLSIGEKSRALYEKLFEAGADRYLLRHETADCAHYSMLHPEGQSLQSRLTALNDLKEIGYQVGVGFMVGSPHQTARNLALDLAFLRSFEPHMIGIGPFLPHHETPFACFPAGSVERTLDMLSLARLLVPRALIPSTTALSSSAEQGRELGLEVGANVVMPNLSPSDVRELYEIYDNKVSAGKEAAESLAAIKGDLEAAGFVPDMSRGDWA